MRINFDPTIKLSDLITTLSFILAVLGLLYGFSKDRTLRERDQVAELRRTLAESLAKLERSSELQGSIYDEVQPVVITTTELWAADSNLVMARDHLWKEISRLDADVGTRIRNEKLSSAYIDLYRVSPQLTSTFTAVMSTLARDRERLRASFENGFAEATSELRRRIIGYLQMSDEDLLAARVTQRL